MADAFGFGTDPEGKGWFFLPFFENGKTSVSFNSHFFFRSYFSGVGVIFVSETLGFFKMSVACLFLEGLLADASSWFSRVVFTKEFNLVKTYFLKHPPT